MPTVTTRSPPRNGANSPSTIGNRPTGSTSLHDGGEMNAIAEHECRARRLLKLLGKPAERRNVDRRRERASALLQIKKMAATRYDSELGWGPVTGGKPIPLV